jgi:hypothetical protein
MDENTLENTDLVKSVRAPVEDISEKFDCQFAPDSLTIIKIGIY